MMSSSISAMTTNSKKLSRKKLAIKSNNSSRSPKIRTGGGPSEMSSIWKISSSQTNSLKSSTGSEAEKWHPKPLQLQTTLTNLTITTPCLCMRIPQVSATSCPPNGNKWKSTKFSMVFWAVESSGTRTIKTKKINKNNCMTLGQVEPLRKEESSI